MANQNNNVDYEDLFDENINPNDFLDFKTGNQKKNLIKLKKYLSTLDEHLISTKKEVFSILYLLDSFLSEDETDFVGEHEEALDKLSDIMNACSVIQEQLITIEDIKNDL
jgi:hypothetical protein